MKRATSTQVHVLMRLLTLYNENTATHGHTLDDVARCTVFRKRNTPRRSIWRALDRFVKLGIVYSPGSDEKRRKLYKIKNSTWAVAYIEGDPDKPWIPVTPTLDDEGAFPDVDEHRDHFDVELSDEVFKVLQRLAVEKNNQFTHRTREYTISINGKSRRGQVFLRPYWRTRIKKDFGEEFYDYLEMLESRGARRGDFCLPIDVKGQRFTIGGRPTQFSASHYPAQLDVRASKGDAHIREGLLALTKQADFNTKVLDFMDATLEALNKQGEAQSAIAETLKKLLQAVTGSGDESQYPAGSDDDSDSLIYR